MGTEDKRRLSTHRAPGAAARGGPAFGRLLLALLGGGMAPAPFPAHRDPLLAAVQGAAPPLLPSLALPPDATAGPPMFAALMRQGDSAMLHGSIAQARSFYERAATVHQASPAAPLAVGKTFDPNILSSLGASGSFADPAMARTWYGRARALGAPAAANLLARLPQNTQEGNAP